MSKYLHEEDLHADKAAYYQERCKRMECVLERIRQQVPLEAPVGASVHNLIDAALQE
jgi:hypothetical protein